MIIILVTRHDIRQQKSTQFDRSFQNRMNFAELLVGMYRVRDKTEILGLGPDLVRRLDFIRPKYASC